MLVIGQRRWFVCLGAVRIMAEIENDVGLDYSQPVSSALDLRVRIQNAHPAGDNPSYYESELKFE